jgi:predicted nuclease with TOPRIM domain
MAKIDYEREIRDAAYLHANLEQREQHLNEENEKLIAENQELSQFTEDGSVIRRNMERLQQETSKIAERIAETDDDYQELMDRNAELIKLVEEAEAKAAN